jgi:hypothetical protein
MNKSVNLQCSFSSKFPLDVIDSALMNSSNSIEPSCVNKAKEKREIYYSFILSVSLLFIGWATCIDVAPVDLHEHLVIMCVSLAGAKCNQVTLSLKYCVLLFTQFSHC